jgi:hypothetical protein
VVEPQLVETELENGSVGLSAWVPFGEGLAIPLVFEYVGVYEGEPPFKWRVLVNVIDGKPVCVEFSCEVSPEDAKQGRAISAEALRRLPLGQLVEDASLMVTRPVDEIPRQLRTWKNIDEARAVQAEAAKQYRRVKRSPRQRTDVTDELLEVVARIYRANIAKGRPTAAVAEQLHYSRPRAGSLVMQARQRGFLPKTEERKARG